MQIVQRGFGAALIIVSAMACSSSKDSAKGPVTYVAQLQGLNATTTGMQTTGEARLVVTGDSLTITMDVKGVPPNMIHLQHFHGFADNHDAGCPLATADTNHDDVIDIRETEPTAGTTMVPFTTDPVSMQIVTDAYPTAGADSSYHYTKTVSLSALDSAFMKTFSDSSLDLGSRVVMVHGVPASTKLKASVASLGTIPAQVTIPIACGKLVKVQN